jgi:hypothetical protein
MNLNLLVLLEAGSPAANQGSRDTRSDCGVIGVPRLQLIGEICNAISLVIDKSDPAIRSPATSGRE